MRVVKPAKSVSILGAGHMWELHPCLECYSQGFVGGCNCSHCGVSTAGFAEALQRVTVMLDKPLVILEQASHPEGLSPDVLLWW